MIAAFKRTFLKQFIVGSNRSCRTALFLVIVSFLWTMGAAGSSQGTSGTVQGDVLDPSGAAVPNAVVQIINPVSGYQKSIQTDGEGHFKISNVPFNSYHLSVNAAGFEPVQKDIEVRSSVPVVLKFPLQLAPVSLTISVQGEAADLLETTPVTHTDVDRGLIDRLPIENQSVGLSEVVTNTSPSIAADANGFFHPLGDHAEAQISLDNQPITDQYSKIFSNQVPLDAIQSMEIITGVPPAEYGDKASLVINANTRSALGYTQAHGFFSEQYGSFGSTTTDFGVGMGGKQWGNFLSGYFNNSSRFLDPPEFTNIHDQGNGEGAFDRLDLDPTGVDSIHFNLSASRSWFQIPNTYDQQAVLQDQRQQVRSLNIAPGYTRLFGKEILLNFNPYIRIDHVQYFPSADPLSDLPATLAQDRRLGVYGARADLSYAKGMNNAKAGVETKYNALTEHFDLGITDPFYNPVCLDASGAPVTSPSITKPAQCVSPLQVNPSLNPGLVPFDLTRGGKLFLFNDTGSIKEFAVYGQDAITVRSFTLNLGVRGDVYRGLSRANQIEPRAGIAYSIQPTSTVLRISYGRFLETPFNENLLLSSATGAGGLASNVFGAFAGVPLQSGRRNQFDAGFEQAFGKHVVVVPDYFWKFTDNAFDFDVLFNTPLTFPITWRKSKIDGLGLRVNLTDYHGLSGYWVMGHTRARYFGPENGGVIFNSPLDTSVFRIDHDEVFEQSTHIQYQLPKRLPWVGFTWRYDSGLVAGSVPDLASALALDGDQQAAIGFFCGSTFATLTSPITSCSAGNFGATRLKIPAPGTENDDTNPPRIAPRNLIDVELGVDNVFRSRRDRYRVSLRLIGINITNKEALYNFLSTFSGTHFVTPRVWQGLIRLEF